jgi:hypothetical protein
LLQRLFHAGRVITFEGADSISKLISGDRHAAHVKFADSAGA